MECKMTFTFTFMSFQSAKVAVYIPRGQMSLWLIVNKLLVFFKIE